MINKNRLIITSIISILLVSTLFLGSTYSIFTSQDIDENVNVYKTGDLDIKYSSVLVQVNDSIPMTDEEADSIIPTRLTVTNDGNVAYMFDIILNDTTSSSDNAIDYKYIKTKVGYLEPKKLSDCTNNVIKEDVILLPGESVDIDVRVWLSDDLSNTEIGKSFYTKLSIDGHAIYNDNNEIDNSLLSLKYMESLFSSAEDINYFKNPLYKEKIKTASFVNYIDTSNAISTDAIWDISEKKDNSIVMWLEPNTINGYYDIYVGSEYKIYTKNLSYYFSDLTVLETVNFDNLDTSNVNNMNAMFCGCTNLIELDLSNFDTSKVTNMRELFARCSSLEELDLSNFDTSKVTNMAIMFYKCSSIINLDISNFNTSNVTNMEYMFDNCVNLANLDISNFNTNKVVNMHGMFSECESLSNLDLSNFDTSEVTIMSALFYNCFNLTTLNLNGWDTSKVTDMSMMFQNCYMIITNITIKNNMLSNYTGIFLNTSTTEDSKIEVNYIPVTFDLVDAMIATKSAESNVVKGELVN